MLCHKSIELGPHVTTYCMLEKNHDGNCSDLFKQLTAQHIENLYRGMRPKRCTAIEEKSGQQCGMPEGHFGRHSNGVYIRWDAK